MDSVDSLRVVLVHDWLTGMRGGEKILEILCRRWPTARLHTLLYKKGSVCDDIARLEPQASFFRFFPKVDTYYRYLLPLMPLAARGWKFDDCDLVISTSHCVAKSARAAAGIPHLCYCFTPMRYAWHMKTSYFGAGGGLKSRLRDGLLSRIRDWDLATADRVTHFVAISQAIRQRIKECYNRDADVIYPPVNTDFYTPADVRREDFYLVFSAFAPYKRLDLAISACNLLKRRLVVIGSGQDEKKLRAMAGPTVEFLGWQSNESIRDQMRRCRALLFPGVEDFGIVPLEAQGCGTPVIAFGEGGATETVVPRHGSWPGAAPTGVWFREQTAECLAEALVDFERIQEDFDPAAIRRHAERFNDARFIREFFEYVGRLTSRPQRAAA